MIDISLCMIVKNEEKVLQRCLDTAKDIVDEIVIVDTGSTDKTKEIAKMYTDKVYDFKWIDDFATARNFAFSKGTKKYLMWLDADDIILKEDREKLKDLKNTLNESIDIVMMKYNVAFDEAGNPTFSYYRERLFKRINNYKWEGKIHEVITPIGNVLHYDAAITHKKEEVKDSKRNLRIFSKMIKDGEKLKPREQFYYARELYYNGYYKKSIKVFEEFLNDGKGWIENNIEACLNIFKCNVMLKEEQKALNALYKSFQYDLPRAEVCCELGKYFLEKTQYYKSIYWYELALKSKINTESGGFVIVDCYGYIPYIQLCVCYDRIGDKDKAVFYNNKAGELKPEDKAYLYNKNYFENLI